VLANLNADTSVSGRKCSARKFIGRPLPDFLVLMAVMVALAAHNFTTPNQELKDSGCDNDCSGLAELQ